jgi:hypothetical protein
MITAQLRPNGAGSVTALTPVGATPNWMCVDDPSIDSDTTYVSAAAGAGALIDTYTFSASSVPSGAIVRNVRVLAYVKRMGADGTCKVLVRIGGVNYPSGSKFLTANYSATLARNDWATNFFTGLPWTVADLSTLQVGIELTPGAASEARCTLVLVEVTYKCIRSPLFSSGVLPPPLL